MKNIDLKLWTQLSKKCAFLKYGCDDDKFRKNYCTNRTQILRSYLLLQ